MQPNTALSNYLTNPLIGEYFNGMRGFLVEEMLTISLVFIISAKAKVDAVLNMKMEVNMKTAIQVICVLAGTALLGR